MNIFEYIDFVKVKMEDAHKKNDKDEFVRLAIVLIDTLSDKIRELQK